MDRDILNGIWPEWKIVRELGRGSFGVVYEAVRQDLCEDDMPESRAAIKVISIPQNEMELDALFSEGLGEDEVRTYHREMVNDFTNEIRLMESFRGVQNIVSVEDYKVVERTQQIGWDIYIRMELLTPFPAWISGKSIDEAEVIRLGCEICTALEICAQRNVIHRDIKPENIFVNEFGHYKLGDFGIARKLEHMTAGMSRKGTGNYMAPEVRQTLQYDARVDLYSLGLVLYRLTNNNLPPFLDTGEQSLSPNARMKALRRRMSGEALPPPRAASPAFAAVILRACAYDPGERYASAAEMKRALQSIAAAETDHASKNTAAAIANQMLQSVSETEKNQTLQSAAAAETNKTLQNTAEETSRDMVREKGKTGIPVMVVSVAAVAVILLFAWRYHSGQGAFGIGMSVVDMLSAEEEEANQDSADAQGVESADAQADEGAADIADAQGSTEMEKEPGASDTEDEDPTKAALREAALNMVSLFPRSAESMLACWYSETNVFLLDLEEYEEISWEDELRLAAMAVMETELGKLDDSTTYYYLYGQLEENPRNLQGSGSASELFLPPDGTYEQYLADLFGITADLSETDIVYNDLYPEDGNPMAVRGEDDQFYFLYGSFYDADLEVTVEDISDEPDSEGAYTVTVRYDYDYSAYSLAGEAEVYYMEYRMVPSDISEYGYAIVGMSAAGNGEE